MSLRALALVTEGNKLMEEPVKDWSGKGAELVKEDSL